MKDPRRLVEDSPSDLERALLEAGVSYRCSEVSRNKTLGALGVAGTAAISASTLGISTTSWLTKLGWPKLLIGVSAIGAATAVPLAFRAWQHRRPQPPATVMANSATAPQLQSHTSSAVNGLEPVVTDATTSPSPGQSVGSAKVPVGPKADAPTAGLTEELSSLDSVRALLARGDAVGALSRLDAYARVYPRGRLRLEAEVLRIDALTKSGQTSAAKKRAESFLRKYPNSVLASRVRALLGS